MSQPSLTTIRIHRPLSKFVADCFDIDWRIHRRFTSVSMLQLHPRDRQFVPPKFKWGEI